ncbi:MAG: helix-turn-helix transcriptional regulator [Kiritimatiellae bacterium]|nr:helix-turn-helix transcriptional regulator [Kiritimatiellia bacterium]
MRKSITSKEYRAVTAELVRLRKQAGLTQLELADRLGREQSFVWRIEKGERRLDVLEFFWVCEQLGVNAPQVYRKLCKHFSTADG